TSPADSLLHYTGTWRPETSPVLSGLQFHAVMDSRSQGVWATASQVSNFVAGRLVHLTAKGWVRFRLPWPVGLGDISSDGHGGLWMMGVSPPSASHVQTWAVHRSAAGHWSRTLLGADGPLRLALIPGTASLWGAGTITGKTGSRAAIWAF